MSHDLKLERLIDGTPDEAFDAFTEADAMSEWYKIDPNWTADLQAHDLRVGGTTTIVFGGPDQKFREDVTYTEVERPNRLVYSETMRRLPDEEGFTTTVTVTFETQDGKTLLTLVQAGFHDAGRRDAHQGGWPQFLDRLDKVVASRRTA